MGFDLNRLRLGDRIVAGGAITLLISMFVFDWFGVSISGTIPGSKASIASTGYNGWETFTNSRWVWLLTAIVALGYVAAIATARHLPEAIQPSSLVTLLGGVSSLLILYRIIHHPTASAGFGGFQASAGIRFGIWLGLLAAVAITVGGYLQMRPLVAPVAATPEDTAAPFSGLVAPGDASAPPSPSRGDEQPPRHEPEPG